MKAEVKQIPPGRRSAGEILLMEARQEGSDLLVMGAYSHSCLREMVLGGVTRHMLAHVEFPVVMVH